MLGVKGLAGGLHVRGKGYASLLIVIYLPVLRCLHFPPSIEAPLDRGSTEDTMIPIPVFLSTSVTLSS